MSAMFTVLMAGNDAVHIEGRSTLTELHSAVLLCIHNQLTGRSTKKFADRGKAVAQTWAAIEEASAGGTLPDTIDCGAEDKASKPKDANQDTVIQEPIASPVNRGKGKAAPKEPKPAKVKAAKAPKEKVERQPRGLTFNLPVGDEQKVPKIGKRKIIFDMLTSEGGATFEQVQQATEWDRKTAYEGIRLLHSYCGFGLKQDAEGNIRVTGYKHK